MNDSIYLVSKKTGQILSLVKNAVTMAYFDTTKNLLVWPNPAPNGNGYLRFALTSTSTVLDSDGSQVYRNPWNDGNPYQQWLATPNGDGYLTISHRASGRYLTSGEAGSLEVAASTGDDT